MFTFTSLGLLPSLEATLAQRGLHRPTPIQAEALPLLLAGRSVVGIAETGSGKTLTYVLPILHQLKNAEVAGSTVDTPARPRALVLVPTRELGEQVCKVFKQFTHDTRLRVRPALGGSAREVAVRNISGPFEVLVATPGRLLQLMDEGGLQLDDVRTLVFDEADQMLDPGFLPAARKIVAASPSHHQLALFSATMPQTLRELVAALFRSPPQIIQTEGSHHVVPTLTTRNRKVVDGKRIDLLKVVLAEPVDGGTLLFVNTHEQVDKLVRELTELGVPHLVYRGEMERQQRKVNLEAFRDGSVKLLIATDLASRGLDVEAVARVINYHLPHQLENYLHRAGRTARAGREGLVVNFVTERDAKLVERLDKVQARPGAGERGGRRT